MGMIQFVAPDEFHNKFKDTTAIWKVTRLTLIISIALFVYPDGFMDGKYI